MLISTSVQEDSTDVILMAAAITSMVVMNANATTDIETLPMPLHLASTVKTKMNVLNRLMTVLLMPPVMTDLVLGNVPATMVGLELVKVVLISMSVMQLLMVMHAFKMLFVPIMTDHLIANVPVDTVAIPLSKAQMASAIMSMNVRNQRALI